MKLSDIKLRHKVYSAQEESIAMRFVLKDIEDLLVLVDSLEAALNLIASNQNTKMTPKEAVQTYRIIARDALSEKT
jgi:molecular chaperone GrpE (heat shock protein)